ncbi:type VII secretion protein EccB [Streptomyces sp. NPDC094468]|uniref:type VII secretion protein EccB n=1 Tax=Streptomyces sp. NPDC094468 TaxID=3366066 RepID=UPI00380F1C1B
MQTRRDHIQAYQFAMGRLATSLVTGNPGRGESPTKRAALGTFFGAGTVIFLCAGSLIYGKLAPAHTDAWRERGSIIVEQETGNRYIYLDQQLRPVRNIASALLLTGHGTVRTVAASELADVPHGSPVGINGAPDALPAPTALLPSVWADCLRPDLTSGRVIKFTPSERVTSFPPNSQVLLKRRDGKRYVLWRGTKYPVPTDATLIALGLDSDRPISAPDTWLANVPTGAVLAPANIDGAGETGGQVAGESTPVGQLFTTGRGTGHSYVMTRDGVAPVSVTEAALMAAQRGSSAPRAVSAASIASARLSHDDSLTRALPNLLDAPAVDTSAQVVCLHETARGTHLETAVSLENGAVATGRQEVMLPPSHGVYAVVQRDSPTRSSQQDTFLITDRGIAYALGDYAVQQDLGIGAAKPVSLPKTLLGMLPRGPVLSRAAAALTVSTASDVPPTIGDASQLGGRSEQVG